MMDTDKERLAELETEQRERVEFTFNGQTLTGYKGEPIAAALLANGIKTIRNCEVTGENRGIYCGIGHCYECRAVVNGVPNVRTCLTPLDENTKVYSTMDWGEGK